MSNKTQLQTNNTALDGYIARINAAKEVAASLPDAGGGGSIETCTVIIAVHVSYPYAAPDTLVSFTQYENGSIIAGSEVIDDISTVGDKVILKNVICNSAISISLSGIYSHYYTQIDNDTTQLIYGIQGEIMVYNAPVNDGDSVRISMGYHID